MEDATPPTINVGIVSAAHIAKKLVAASLSHPTSIAFVAVGSRDIAKSEAFIQATGLAGKATAYGSYQELLQDPRVDAIYLPLPSNLHRTWVEKAAALGKHVLCEKPISMAMEDAEAMAQACKAAGVMFMDGTMWLHNPRTAMMSRVLHEEMRLGPLSHIVCNFSFMLWNTETDVRLQKDLDGLGVLGDIGWYCTAMALWAKQYNPPATVAAHPGGTFSADGVPTSIGATLTWEDGCTATFFCSFKACFSQDTKILGPVGSLALWDTFLPEDESKCGFQLKAMPRDAPAGAPKYGNNSTVEVHPDMPQEARMLRTFAACVAAVKQGQAPDWTWLNRSLLTQRVVCAIMSSAQNKGEAVPVQGVE